MGIEIDVECLRRRIEAIERRIDGAGGLRDVADRIVGVGNEIRDNASAATAVFNALSKRISVLEEKLAEPAPSEPPKPTPEPGHEYDGVWRENGKSFLWIIYGKTIVYISTSPIRMETLLRQIRNGDMARAELPPEIANALVGAGSGLGRHPADVAAAREKVIEAAKAVYLTGLDVTTASHCVLARQAFIDAVQKLFAADRGGKMNRDTEAAWKKLRKAAEKLAAVYYGFAVHSDRTFNDLQAEVSDVANAFEELAIAEITEGSK